MTEYCDLFQGLLLFSQFFAPPTPKVFFYEEDLEKKIFKFKEGDTLFILHLFKKRTQNR